LPSPISSILLPTTIHQLNPWKAAIILEELGLENNIIMLDMFSVKKAPYTDLNPNG
jgi:glutathione S-transferase